MTACFRWTDLMPAEFRADDRRHLEGDSATRPSEPRRGALAALLTAGHQFWIAFKLRLIIQGRASRRRLEPRRHKVLDELQMHTTRIKVVRMAAIFAASTKLPWATLAGKHSERIGGRARWVAIGCQRRC